MVLWKIIKVKSPLLGTSKRENTFDGKVTPLRICQGLLENIKWWVQGCSWQEHHNEVDQKPRSCSWLSSCRAAMGLFLRDYEAAAGRAELRWWWNQPRWHKLYTKNHFLNQHHLFVKFCFWNNYGLKGNCRDNREGPCVFYSVAMGDCIFCTYSLISNPVKPLMQFGCPFLCCFLSPM